MNIIEAFKSLSGGQAELKASVDSLTASLAERDNKLVQLQTLNAELMAKLSERETTIASLNTEVATLKANVPEQIKTEAAKQAVVIAAAQGVPAVPSGAAAEKKPELKGFARVVNALKNHKQ